MIRINLLHSVTERNSGAVASVERKVASPVSRLMLLTLVVGVLLAAVIGWDIISTQQAKAEAERQLAEQKKIEEDLKAVIAEQKELEQKIQNIDLRIEAIKKLRASQAGPSAVLEALKERITMVPGIYLLGVEQTGEQLTIKGNSEDEAQVTQFGRSLEFSGGLFSNLNIETQRKAAPNQPTQTVAPGQEAPPQLEIVEFTIRTAYTPSKASASKDATTAANTPPNQTGGQNPAGNQQPQVAKNENN